MGTFASDLKSEREKRKVSLSQIAAETRISLRHLQSLEEGRYKDLPGGMYNRAFLKAYCDFLSLDSREMIQRFEAEISPVSDKPPKSKSRLPPQSRSFRISPVLIWALMLLISATGLFFSRRWITAMFSPYFSHTPPSSSRYESVQQPAPRPPQTVPAAPAPVQTGLPQELEPSEVSATPASTQPEGGSDISPTQPATVTETSALRLEINATEECWVSVNRDGSSAVRKVMEPGEVQSVGASRSLELILGNAAGVRLKINGKPAKPLGKRGEVVKFLINQENLQDFIDQSAG
jgi:cytoskeleton protein RodZ